MAANKPPITIKAWEDDTNLRTVSWNQGFLEATAAEHELKHGEAVGFSNKAQTLARLVVVFYGMPVLMLPPTDPEKRLSLYLVVNRFLRRFAKTQELSERFAGEIKHINERIERRKAIAKKARRKRAA